MDIVVGNSLGSSIVPFRLQKTYEKCKISVGKIAVSNDRFSNTEFTGRIVATSRNSYLNTQNTDVTFTINVPKNVSSQELCSLINNSVGIQVPIVTDPPQLGITASITETGQFQLVMFSIQGTMRLGSGNNNSVTVTWYMEDVLFNFLPMIVQGPVLTIDNKKFRAISINNKLYGSTTTNDSIIVFPPNVQVNWLLYQLVFNSVTPPLTINNYLTLTQSTAVSDPITTFLVEPMIGAIISAPIVQPNSPFILTILPPSNNQWIIYEPYNLQWTTVSYLPQNFTVSLYHIYEDEKGNQKTVPLNSTTRATITINVDVNVGDPTLKNNIP
jgi:hypothetical protein